MAGAKATTTSANVSSFRCITWNIEGLGRNILNLKHFCTTHEPDLIFLSEPQVFQCDVAALMSHFSGSYLYSLNSLDKYELDLPLMKSRAQGGTMVIWKLEHDPYITVHSVSSPSFLPVIFHPPNYAPSIHVCVYLPTQGQEQSFIEDLANLQSTLESLQSRYPDTPVYLRGDFNVNGKNMNRKALFNAFITLHNLHDILIEHPTYHHFLGNGASDSSLDKILFSTLHGEPEKLEEIICKRENTFVDSHHDLLISSWIPCAKIYDVDSNDIPCAPKLHNDRHRVLWTDEGVHQYQSMIQPHLSRLQNIWLPSVPSRSCMSLVLQATNDLLTTCAKSCNKIIDLSVETMPRSQSSPRHLRLSARKLIKEWKHIKGLKSTLGAQNPYVLTLLSSFKQTRYKHRKMVRRHLNNIATLKMKKLMSNPKETYACIRKSKNIQSGKINKLKVGSLIYSGDRVHDGFFTSISQLKCKNKVSTQLMTHLSDSYEDYANIIELSKTGAAMDPISQVDALNILNRMKSDVLDSFNMTPNHYLYAGPAGWEHFRMLVNALMANVDNIDILEVNRAHAIVLFKGHGKDKSCSRSYRTISSCPVVAKALDILIRDKNIDAWNSDQAST